LAGIATSIMTFHNGRRYRKNKQEKRQSIPALPFWLVRQGRCSNIAWIKRQKKVTIGRKSLFSSEQNEVKGMRFKRKIPARFCFTVFVTLLLNMGISSTGSAIDGKPRQAAGPQHVTVILERVYLDGEVSQEVIEETYWSRENFWAKYDAWQVKDRSASRIVFTKQIDDISPLLKANGYFGITEDGVLTIFNGRPGRSKIIQSFFQIDMKKLESHKQEELLQGIPIKTKDHYVKVLETFKHYSVTKQ
jgi:forespore regulator of the sigma-K checkpoint